MANADKTHNALNDATPGGDDDTNDKLTSIAVKREKKSNDAANDGTTQKTPGQTKRTNTEARKARAKRKAFKGELYDMISKLLVVGAIYCTLLFAIGKDHMLPTAPAGRRFSFGSRLRLEAFLPSSASCRACWACCSPAFC
ncbi:sodium/hydrogen exchanger 9B2 [Pycnococcus provasolii]